MLNAADGKPVGAVGQGSRIVMRVEQDQGRVIVQWGPGLQQRCAIDYALPERARQRARGYDELSLTCAPMPADGGRPTGPGPLARR